MSATQMQPLTNEQRAQFEKFSKVCAANGIRDLTEEEYRTHVIGKPGIGTAPVIRTIRHYRKLAGHQYVGYALGSRDRASQDYPLDETKMGDLLVWDDQEGFQTFVVWDGFDGRMGSQHSLILEHKGQRPSVKSTNIDIHGQRFRPDRFAGWTPLAELKDFVRDPDNQYPIIALRGKVSGVYRLKDFDAGKVDGKWQEAPVAQNQSKMGRPAFLVLCAEKGISVSVEFGPYKNGEPATNMDYLKTADYPNLDALAPLFDEAIVGLIGEYRDHDIKSDGEGGDVTKIYLRGYSLYDLSTVDEEGSGTTETAAASPPPAPAQAVEEKYPDAKTNLAQLMGAVKIAVDQIGSTATPELVRQALGKNEDVIPAELLGSYDDTLLQTAIDKVQGKIPTPASAPAKVPAKKAKPDAKPVDPKVLTRFTKLISKNDEGDGVSIDFIVSEADDLWDLAEAEVDDIIWHMLDSGAAFEPALGKIRLL